jgi:hypothetical protein
MARRGRAKFLELSTLRGAVDSFYFSEGGDAKPWTTDRVATHATRNERAFLAAAPVRPARHAIFKGESVMKKLLAFLFAVTCGALRQAHGVPHDDTLRANQGDRTTAFSFWRALVS